MATRLVQSATTAPLPPAKTTQPVEYKSFIEFFKANVLTYLNPAASQPPFTNGGAAMGDVISDWSWLIRVMMPEGAVTQLMGCPTPENLFRGTWAAVKAWDAYKKAHLVSDSQGMLEAGLDTFRGIVQSLGGGFYLAYRTLTGIADIKHVNTALNATTPLGKAAYITGMIGNVLFLVLFAVFGGMGLASFYNSASFRMDLKACKKDERLLLDFLKKKCDVDPSSKFEKYTTTEQIQAYKEKCANSALDALTDVICAFKESEEPGEALPSKEVVRESLKELFKNDGKANNKRQDEFCTHLLSSMGIQKAPKKWNFSPLELMGFKIEVTKRQHRKQIKLDRVGAGKVSKAFAKGLEVRLTEGSPEVIAAASKELKVLKKETLSNNKIGLVVASSLIIVGALGVAASVIGLFPVLGPVMLMSLIVLTLLVCAGMYGADTFFMKMGWSNGEPGRYDKHYVAFEAGMLVTMMAVSVGVTLGFGLPILPLILAVVFGAMGLGLCGITWDELSYKELKYYWEHPTLENFPQMLNKILSPESLKYSQEEQEKRIKDLFHNLKKEDRDAIRERFVTLSKTEAFLNGSRDLYTEYSEGKLKGKDLDRFVRGVKKTRNYFWKEWSRNKAEGKQDRADRNRAWALQAEAIYVRAKKGEQMADLWYETTVFNRLKEDLKYLTARESDATKLRGMAHCAIHKRATEAKEAQKPKVASLSDALPGLRTA
jgi:uncharacterized membrane-anchored protein